MFVRGRKFTRILALLVSLLLPSVASAQETGAGVGSWSALNAISSGSRVVVELKGGKPVEGKLGSVSDAGLSLSVRNRPVELKREDVLRVYQLGRKSAAKATLIGAGVGAGAGALVGVAADSGSDGFESFDKAVTAGLTVVGAGVGALTGYLVGRRGRKRVLVYAAGQP